MTENKVETYKYPDDFINKIICGDCLKLIKSIPDKKIDCVIIAFLKMIVISSLFLVRNIFQTFLKIIRLLIFGNLCYIVLKEVFVLP